MDLAQYYQLIKALHIIAFTSWMAGMFYLPRLFAYHANATPGSEMDSTFKVMERRLLRIIINPAMIATFIFGILLYMVPGVVVKGAAGWFHMKILLVLMMTAIHGFLSVTRKKFEKGTNTRPAKFYKMLNEVPTVLFIAIVLLVVIKPF